MSSVKHHSRSCLAKFGRSGKASTVLKPGLHTLRSTFKSTSRSKHDSAAKIKKNATYITLERDMSDFTVSSESESCKDSTDSWNKLECVTPSKSVQHPEIVEDSNEWIEAHGIGSKKSKDTREKSRSENVYALRHVSANLYTKASNENDVKPLDSIEAIDSSETPAHVNNCHIDMSNSNIGQQGKGVMDTHIANAGDAKYSSVETITAEMERLKEMAQMMSEMNKRLSSENEAMMDLMRSVQPRTKQLMDQLRNERREIFEVRSRSLQSSKEQCLLKSELSKLRSDLQDEKDKFTKLKSNAVHLRSQYVIKVSKLQQLKRNARKLINRYRELKEAHSNCSEERELLRAKLIEVVAKFDKLKTIANHFQEGGGITNKFQELQHEKTTLQDEKAKLELRVRERDDLEKRMTKLEMEAHNMAADYEGDIVRLRSELEERENSLVKFESLYNGKCQENALLSKDVKRLNEEYEMLKTLLNAKERELDDTKERLGLQDENIKKLQDAYLQMTMRMTDDVCSVKGHSERSYEVKAFNSNAVTEDGVSKTVLEKVENVVNDVADRTYAVRKSPVGICAKGSATPKSKNSSALSKKTENAEQRTMRKVFRPTVTVEPRIPKNTATPIAEKSRTCLSNVLKQFDEETQTDEPYPTSRSEPLFSAAVKSTLSTLAKKVEEKPHFRTVRKPSVMRERTVLRPRPNNANNCTKNNNSSNRTPKVWRPCRNQDEDLDTYPSHCAVVDSKDPIRFSFKTNPPKDNGAVYGRLDKVYMAIRAQEKGIEQLKSQIDTFCDSSHLDDISSDETNTSSAFL